MDDYFPGRPSTSAAMTPAAPKNQAAMAWAPLQPMTALPTSQAAAAPIIPMPAGTAYAEVVRRDGRIVQVIVTCPCGERTTIDCVYER